MDGSGSSCSDDIPLQPEDVQFNRKSYAENGGSISYVLHF